MKDRDYAFKSLKEITYRMKGQNLSAVGGHTKDITKLLVYYQGLIMENRSVLTELESQCQEQINEDLAYALQYLQVCDIRLDVMKMKREMDSVMQIYGLSDLLYRAFILVEFYAPNGRELCELLKAKYCTRRKKTDIEVMCELGVGKTKYYELKRDAHRFVGFYFYEIVIKQAKHKRFKPSFGIEEE